MKLVNTKDIKDLLENGLADFSDLFDSGVCEAGPCREIRIEPERGSIILLVDHREIMRQSMKALGFRDTVPDSFVYELLALWRAGRMDDLQSRLCL